MATTAQGTERVHGTAEGGMDRRWLTLQRGVAAAMILLFAGVMVLIQQTLIPPLAVAGLLFAIPLGLTWVWPRGSAVAIGIVSAIWLLLQVANLELVVPDLARPEATLLFMTTAAMGVIPLAGAVGLVGVLRRASGRIASGTLAGATALLGIALLASVIAAAAA